MEIAIDVAGFTPADSDGFRRAMGTWRSTREMEKLHRRFVDGCIGMPGMAARRRRGAVPPGRGVRLASGSRRATRPRSPGRPTNRLPQAVLPGAVHGRADQRPADGLLPDRGARQRREAPRRRGPAGRRQRERYERRPNGWAGRAGRWPERLATTARHDDDPGEPLPDGAGIERRPRPVRSSACIIPAAARGTGGRPKSLRAMACAWACGW